MNESRGLFKSSSFSSVFGRVKSNVNFIGKGETIQIAVRVRPMRSDEMRKGAKETVSVNGKNCLIFESSRYSSAACNVDQHGYPQQIDPCSRKFSFDHCFFRASPFDDSEYCGQEEIYNAIGIGVVEQLWEGYNGTIFAYGQTGSGKSYTMLGKTSFQNQDPGRFTNEEGLIPRICKTIFTKIDATLNAQGNGHQATFLIEVSYMEIYNEKVRDLFDVNAGCGKTWKGLKVREDPAVGTFVEGLTVVSVISYDEIARLIEIGSRARTTESTDANTHSSRSHTLFMVTVRQQHMSSDGGVQEKISRLNLVDLAGSERVGSTGAMGTQLVEAGYINKSLSALSDVIKALKTNQRREGLKHGSGFVPYRNSLLTRLLKESLGGNAKTIMLACVSPCYMHYNETLSTLKYAQRVRSVQTYARINQEKANKTSVLKLMNEVEHLRIELMHAKQVPNKGHLKEGKSVMYLLDPNMEKEIQNLQLLVKEKEACIEELAKDLSKKNSCRTTLNSVMQRIEASRSRVTSEMPNEGFELELPRLVNLNQDPQFSECIVYDIGQGITTIGSADDADIQLCGSDILPQHALMMHSPGGMITIVSQGKFSKTYVNGSCLTDKGDDTTQVLLTHRSRVIFGRHHVMRFEYPSEMAWQGCQYNRKLTHVDWMYAQNELLRKNPALFPQYTFIASGMMEQNNLDADSSQLKPKFNFLRDFEKYDEPKKDDNILSMHPNVHRANILGKLSYRDENDDKRIADIDTVPACSQSTNLDGESSGEGHQKNSFEGSKKALDLSFSSKCYVQNEEGATACCNCLQTININAHRYSDFQGTSSHFKIKCETIDEVIHRLERACERNDHCIVSDQHVNEKAMEDSNSLHSCRAKVTDRLNKSPSKSEKNVDESRSRNFSQSTSISFARNSGEIDTSKSEAYLNFKSYDSVDTFDNVHALKFLNIMNRYKSLISKKNCKDIKCTKVSNFDIISKDAQLRPNVQEINSSAQKTIRHNQNTDFELPRLKDCLPKPPGNNLLEVEKDYIYRTIQRDIVGDACLKLKALQEALLASTS